MDVLPKETWVEFEKKIGIWEQKNVYESTNVNADWWIIVKTGDRKGAGTDSYVYVALHDDKGTKTEPVLLDYPFYDDLETGQVDVYPCNIPPELNFGKLEKIEVWREKAWFDSDWFGEVIVMHNAKENKSYYFPLLRWFKPGVHHLIYQYDTFLPQDEPNPLQRKDNLEEARVAYRFEQKAKGLPVQVKEIPKDENFSTDYRWNIAKRKAQLMAAGFWKRITSPIWERIEDLAALYRNFDTPKSFEDSCCFRHDEYFGAQRLVACNPNVIKLCQQLPPSMNLTDATMRKYLRGLTLKEAMAQRRLFLVDYKILEDLPTRDNAPLCSPLCILFWTDEGTLVPIAIQLYQKEDEPVFYPDDPEDTWTVAKLWFNHADSAIHQCNTHLGLTHLLMEGICCSMHRNLADNHPIFRLLAPHFLYLIAIDAHGLKTLINPGGWADNAMSIGVTGMFHLMARGFAKWRFDVDGLLPKQLESRGLLDTNILPGVYGYRDDALLYYDAIRKYASMIINHYYNDKDKLKGDSEIQQWAKELTTPIERGGVGLKGVPGNGEFANTGDLIDVVTGIIFTCCVQHSAANFPQYDQYGYVVNYPGALTGKPPRDKTVKTEADLVAALPSLQQTLNMMTVTKILSERGTNKLGDWELQYQYDPPALLAEQQFREDLKKIEITIEERCKKRKPPYTYEYLHPREVPNAISI